MTTLQVWKKVPTIKGASRMKELIAIVGKSCVIRPAARELCERVEEKFSLPAGDTSVALLSMADLGFSQGVPFYEFYDRAAEQGYQLCTPEVGLLIRKAFSKGEQHSRPDRSFRCIYVAMEPVEIGIGETAVLSLEVTDTEAELRAARCMPQTAFGPSEKWAFKVPA